MSEWITRAIPFGTEGDLLVTLASTFGHLKRQGEGFNFHSLLPLDEPGMRFNDGALDPDGYLWAGTMRVDEDAQSGRWWRFATDGSSRRRLDTPAFTVTNGPAFDAANAKVYLTDSAAQIIYRGNYDAGAGVTGLAPWRQFEAGDGCPDGMIIGPDNLLWVAFWDGACLRAFDETGSIVHQVELPVMRPTSIAFADDAILYATSAQFGLQNDGVQGQTLRIRLRD
ncbi:hypothetical protein GCM10011614_33550 [Novosphingobium colocasiae]|uniref:SMP-30/Gluconolactonase/LRE-like region domain-containing protein n=3 Tax=Bacteria TaxID=2 RepID=A0A918PNC7_9SPHN|nr:hypothetical protein GCM10011614_33550 [Novosphingobium colocasiae]